MKPARPKQLCVNAVSQSIYKPYKGAKTPFHIPFHVSNQFEEVDYTDLNTFAKFERKLKVGAFVFCIVKKVAGPIVHIKKKITIKNCVTDKQNTGLEKKNLIVVPELNNLIQNKLTKQWYKVTKRGDDAMLISIIEVPINKPQAAKKNSVASAKKKAVEGGEIKVLIAHHDACLRVLVFCYRW